MHSLPPVFRTVIYGLAFVLGCRELSFTYARAQREAFEVHKEDMNSAVRLFLEEAETKPDQSKDS